MHNQDELSETGANGVHGHKRAAGDQVGGQIGMVEIDTAVDDERTTGRTGLAATNAFDTPRRGLRGAGTAAITTAVAVLLGEVATLRQRFLLALIAVWT